jgi:archaellum biogenesis ATPase FlaH
MTLFAQIFNSSFEEDFHIVELNQLPEELKKYPEGLYRAPFFLETDDAQAFKSLVKGQKIAHAGPLNLVFAVRRASDILLEGCNYQDLKIEIETGGRKLPQLPGTNELRRLLGQDDCLIHINDTPYKPASEVFGFQQVYDDSVSCIDELKKLGIPQEAMAIFATPEEIAIEIHPGITGFNGSENLSDLYYRLLCRVGGITDTNNKPTKNGIKTLVLQGCLPDYQSLIPGSTHPRLHRTKVGVGPSHFAYGVAAFSDFCAKKRSIQECLQETLNWLKFVNSELPPVEGLGEKISSLPEFPLPGIGKQKKGAAAAGSSGHSGRFIPLKEELAGADECYQLETPTINSISPGLDKCLGGGWVNPGVHLIVGPSGAGKASLLIQQALKSSSEASVLYVSYEHSLREFALRASLSGKKINMSDLLGMVGLKDQNGQGARKTMASAIEKFRADIGENFFFSGAETPRTELETDEIAELARMLPQSDKKLIILESVNSELLGGDASAKLQQLRQIAADEKLTILLALHHKMLCGKRPHFVEGEDLDLLEKYQRHSDSMLVCLSEKLNLRRFVAMVKGQIDAGLVGKLEQKALQLSGGKRLKSDTYSLLRLIHSRYGRRELLLFLYQPDFVKMHEIASITLNRI